MRMHKYSTALSLALLASAPPAFAQASAALRIACDGTNAGATVSINNVVKGDCPLDVSVAPGNIRLRVSKNVNGNQERVFEQEFRMTAGTGKRIDVELGKPQTSLAAQKGVEDAVEAEARPREEEQLRALPGLIKKAEGGDSAAMLRVGQVYAWGLAGNVDFKQAAKWYERAARAENPAGMSAFANYVFSGKGGVSRNPTEAIAMWERAAALGDGSAMGSLGSISMNGNKLAGIPANEQLAKTWFGKAANTGDYMAMQLLAFMLANPTNEADEDTPKSEQWANRAIPAMESQVSNGNPDPMGMLGRAYIVAKKPELGAKLRSQYLRYAKKAAATGEVSSVLALAEKYEEGLFGVPKDKAMAIQLARKAAAQGDKDANTYLQKLLAQ